MSSQFVAEIKIFAGNFPPKGWAVCNGQIMSIAQNTALFSLLGTQYGGNGQTTFALPNLQGRAPMHQGQGPGLTDRVIGEQGGEETVTLTSQQVGSHNHVFNCSAGTKGSNSTVTNQSNADQTLGVSSYASATDGTAMSPAMIQSLPLSQPHENRQPYLGVTFIIALQGIFPARN